MRKKAFLVLFILVSSSLYGQGFIKNLPVFTDSKLIDSITISLRKQNIDTIYCFLTQINKVDLTFLFWLNNGEMFALQVTDTTLSKVHKVDLDVIKKMDIRTLAINESEDKLKFIPPITHSKDCDIIIFYSKKDNYLIEAGKSSGFALDHEKEKSRLKFVYEVKHELCKKKISWEIAASYNRYEN